jgi:Protein of unknown function (DUF2441)
MWMVAALERFQSHPAEYQTENWQRMLREATAALKEQCTLIREYIFEEVRANYFPQLPSRRTCIWVVEKNAVPYWWARLDGEHKEIFRLDLTGVLHRADERHLAADALSLTELRAMAFELSLIL